MASNREFDLNELDGENDELNWLATDAGTTSATAPSGGRDQCGHDWSNASARDVDWWHRDRRDWHGQSWQHRAGRRYNSDYYDYCDYSESHDNRDAWEAWRPLQSWESSSTTPASTANAKDEKEHVPEWDGKSETLKTYRRRVAIYVANSRTSPSRQGGKLLERFTGAAFQRTENLDPNTLKTDDGVKKLMDFLSSKFEPREAVRVGRVMDEYTEKFKREFGEEIQEFDTKFESRTRELEEVVGVQLPPLLKAHYFLKKLGLPPEKESQIITGALNRYEYEALRDSAMASIPNVKMLRTASTSAPPPGHGGWQLRNGQRGHGVNATQQKETDPSESAEPSEGIEDEQTANNAEGLPEELVGAIEEHEVNMTQAKKFRGEMEKARGFYLRPEKRDDAGQRERMMKLKQRPPCARCGKLGHWKDDPECPRHPQRSNATHVTVHHVHLNTGRHSDEIMVVDTACARTVAGHG